MRGKNIARLVVYFGVPAGLFVVGVGALPLLAHKGGSRMKACQENLAKIDGAKERFARAKGLKEGDVIAAKDLAEFGGLFPKGLPQCFVAREDYVLNPVGAPPQCKSGIPGHSLEKEDPASVAFMCRHNLTILAKEKERFQASHGKQAGDAASMADVLAERRILAQKRSLPGDAPRCPATQKPYAINPFGTLPTCDSGLPGHSISDLSGL